MNGVEMMLKSIGIETDKIKELLKPEYVEGILGKVEKMLETLEAIDKKVTRIEIKLETIPDDEAMKLLVSGHKQATQDAEEFVREYNNGNSRDDNNGKDAIG